MMGGEDESKPTFGHLIILMRDVDGKVAEVEELVLGQENTRKLKHDQKKDPLARNAIREGLEDAFQSITFHTMPSPHPRISGVLYYTTLCAAGRSFKTSKVLILIAHQLKIQRHRLEPVTDPQTVPFRPCDSIPSNTRGFQYHRWCCTPVGGSSRFRDLPRPAEGHHRRTPQHCSHIRWEGHCWRGTLERHCCRSVRVRQPNRCDLPPKVCCTSECMRQSEGARDTYS